MTVDEAIKFCKAKQENIKLRTEPETFIQITGMLEELRCFRNAEEKKCHIKEYMVDGKKCYFYFDENNMCQCSEEVIELLFGTWGSVIDEIEKNDVKSVEELTKKIRKNVIDEVIDKVKNMGLANVSSNDVNLIYALEQMVK